MTIPKVNVTPFLPENLILINQWADDKAGVIIEKIPYAFNEKGEIIPDPVRQIIYLGQTFLNGRQLNFNIPAQTLNEAIQLFSSCAAGVIEELQSQAIQARIAQPGGLPGGLVLDGKPRR